MTIHIDDWGTRRQYTGKVVQCTGGGGGSSSGGNVITVPVVTGPTVVGIGSTVTLTATASSLLAGGSVSSFTWVKPGNVQVVVPAVNGESSVSFTANGNDGDALTTTVYAKDNAGNKSQVTSHAVTLSLIVIPDVTNMTTNIPSTIAAGESVSQLSITGAMDPDGGSVTYGLTLPAGVTASKTTGLTNGELFSITAAANVTVNPTANVTITVTASGGGTTQVVRRLAVVATHPTVDEVSWTTPGSYTWTVPENVYSVCALTVDASGGDVSFGDLGVNTSSKPWYSLSDGESAKGATYQRVAVGKNKVVMSRYTTSEEVRAVAYTENGSTIISNGYTGGMPGPASIATDGTVFIRCGVAGPGYTHGSVWRWSENGEPHGITDWYQVALPATTAGAVYSEVCYTGSKFIVFSGNGDWVYSNDAGASWLVGAGKWGTPPPSFTEYTDLYAVCDGTGNVVLRAMVVSQTFFFYGENDGASWTKMPTAADMGYLEYGQNAVRHGVEWFASGGIRRWVFIGSMLDTGDRVSLWCYDTKMPKTPIGHPAWTKAPTGFYTVGSSDNIAASATVGARDGVYASIFRSDHGGSLLSKLADDLASMDPPVFGDRFFAKDTKYSKTFGLVSVGQPTMGDANINSSLVIVPVGNTAYGQDGSMGSSAGFSLINPRNPGAFGVSNGVNGIAAYNNDIPTIPGSQIPVVVPPTDGGVRVIWGAGRSFPSNAASAASAGTQIGIVLVAEGGGAGQWQRVDGNFNPVNYPFGGAFFNSHPTYAGVVAQTIDGQAMMKVPKYYLKTGAVPSGTYAGKRYWMVSDQPASGFSVHPAFMNAGAQIDQFWVGKYQGTNDGGTKLGSAAAVTPLASIDFPTMQSRANARNTGGVTGFGLWNIYQLSAIQALALIEMGGSDSQTLIGQGHVNGSGALATDNATVAQATWRGIVGLWGNVWQMVDGLQTDASSKYMIWDKNGNKTYKTTSLTAPPGNYQLTMATTTGTDYDLATVFAAETTYAGVGNGTYGDYFYQSPGCIAFHGGYWGFSAVAGLFCLLITHDASASAASIGGRLAKV